MDRFIRTRRGVDEPEPRRISTPAGARLSTILENSTLQPPKPSRLGRLPLSLLAEEPRNSEEGSTRGYSYSVFSDKSKSPVPSAELQAGLKNKKQIAKRGGWKRLALIALLLLLILVGVIVGVAVGVTVHHQKSSQGSGSGPSPGSAPNGAPGSSNSSSSKDFPVGSWSMVTFLDTVSTNCTSNPVTWTCYPYTTYSVDPTRSQAIFNWVISVGSKADTYEISSTNNPFAITFQNVPLTLVNKGMSSEGYKFLITMDKEVVPTTAITTGNSAATCFFNSTDFHGYLYTKQAADYPPAGQSTGGSYPSWPFAVRVEQVITGGDNTPNCYTTVNGNLGANITSLSAENASNMCDCLYINYM